jgi:hypothetical protein
MTSAEWVLRIIGAFFALALCGLAWALWQTWRGR